MATKINKREIPNSAGQRQDQTQHNNTIPEIDIDQDEIPF